MSVPVREQKEEPLLCKVFSAEEWAHRPIEPSHYHDIVRANGMRLRWQENGASQLDILRAVRANGEIQQSVVEEKNADSVHNIKCPTCRKTGDVDLSKHVIHGCSDPVPENYEGEKSVCVVCTEKWADVFFVGCGHNVMCQGCVRKMSAIGQ